jgi:hypothetical protein
VFPNSVCRYQRISSSLKDRYRLQRSASARSAATASPARTSGDPSAVAPPVPIPNTEVKRCSPDGSTAIGRARVGRRQNQMPGEFISSGILLFTCDYSSTAAGRREPSRRESSEIDGSPKGEHVGTCESVGRRQNQSVQHVVRRAGRFVLATSYSTRMGRNGRAA